MKTTTTLLTIKERSTTLSSLPDCPQPQTSAKLRDETRASQSIRSQLQHFSENIDELHRILKP